jgi:hypothetical protein
MDINKIMALITTLLSVVLIVIMEVSGETALRWKIPVGKYNIVYLKIDQS